MKRQREYGGHFGIPVEVRIFGRDGMRVKTYDEQLWCLVIDWRPSVVFLHLGGNALSSEQQGYIGEMSFGRVRSLEAAVVVCV